MNDKAPIYTSLAGAAVLFFFLLLVQPYSAPSVPPSPWDAYTRPAKRFLSAALRRDSLELMRRSASSEPVAWGLAAASRYPDSLAVWAREARVWSGIRHGDTAEVLFYTDTKVCDERPIWLRFLGDSGQFKVVEAGSSCFDPERRPPPRIRRPT